MIERGRTRTDPLPPFPDVTWRMFYNRYPEHFQDTNNLSLVVFLKCKGLSVLIPGDLETAGWQRLLQDAAFQQQLGSVGVFIAPHHGRENGYCAEVFQYCHPNVVIFSDGPMKFATQETAGIYGRRASGVQFNGQTRKVLTTRNDGALTWNL